MIIPNYYFSIFIKKPIYYFEFLNSILYCGPKAGYFRLLYYRVFVNLSSILVNSGPYYHTHYVHFKPNTLMVTIGIIKNTHRVRY